MKTITLNYGKSELVARVPDDALVVAPKTCTSPPLSSAALSDAFDKEGLLEALRAARRIALVVNDRTRKGGMRLTLDALVPWIDRAGVDRDRVAMVVAYGLHARQSDDASREAYGDPILSRVRLVHHDAKDENTLENVGYLPSGAPLKIAAEVARADLRILVGAIGFHYHAGFSGGRKALMPGVADEASIVRNHLRVLDPNGPNGRAAGCAPARLDGNPVSDEMLAGARLVDAFHGRTFLANAIVSAEGEVIDVACGLAHERAFRDGCARLLSTNAVVLDRENKPEIVVASAGGWPYDASLYQAHKAYDNAFRTRAQTLVFLAKCEEGLGHPRFASWLEHPTREAHYAALRDHYEIVGQTSLAVRDKAAATRTIAVTDLDAETCAKLGWEKAATIDDAIARARGDGRWGVLPRAGAVLPIA